MTGGRGKAQRWVWGLFFFLLISCQAPPAALRVGTNVWPGYEPLYLARERGYFPQGSIELVDFTSATEVIRAYRNGLLDVAALTADETLVASEGLGPQQIILVCDTSQGADVLLAKPDITSLSSLKGRRIGVETTALGAYMLARVLEKAHLTRDQVEVVSVPLFDHERAFRSESVDAVITFSPHSSGILASGARRLFSSAEIPGQIVDVLLTSATPRPARVSQLDALVQGWFRSVADLRADPIAAAGVVATREHVSPGQYLESLRGLAILGRPENLAYLNSEHATLGPVLERLRQVMVELQPGTHPIVPALESGFVQRSEP